MIGALVIKGSQDFLTANLGLEADLILFTEKSFK